MSLYHINLIIVTKHNQTHTNDKKYKNKWNKKMENKTSMLFELKVSKVDFNV